ncbi:MAG: CDGSH iron-sulfur domain-containing protein [Euryarchaeota archaeon]|jgi:CDGSH-type Zn-finger protein|nr:CDGSH iron-sulfur domain-containing protein [Euryarchaeota archaeon]
MATKKNKEPQHDKYSIKVSKNGPYLVSSGVPLHEKIIKYDSKWDTCEWQDGKTYPRQETYALCRCGQSHNKPFCDGTHLKAKFDGTETASHTIYRDQAVLIDGPGLKLTDAKILCASARFCHRAGGIWNIIHTSNNPGDKKIAIEEAADCPSGRLVVYDKETEKSLEPTLEPSIALIEDPSMNISGPLWIRGGIPITSSDDTSYEIRNRGTLCRCGKSHNKPFCDSSHWPE